MLKGLTALPALALAGLLALPAMAEQPTAETVVARVNGQEITLGHLIVARTTLPQQYQQLPPEVLYDAILEQLIQQTALQQEHGPELPLSAKLSLENETRQLLAADEIEKVMAEGVSDEAIKAAYDAKYGESYHEMEYNASHILLETEDEAKAVRDELEKGADFAELAKEKSTGPSGPNGGELGWFSAGMMVPAFEAAVMDLKPGEISQPVQTQFGWHVVKLNDSREKTPPTLDEAHDELLGELQQKAVADHIKALVDKAEVDRPEVEGLNPAMISDLDLVRK
ncbi:peptidylprolyl isomerase [Pseudodonghicola flavimaris]|uniref:Parvulin-like PPIase n=1 Tax=Pseudodonghicola flavimaris TaxID=3050036 RepID=A0ABT7EZX5_9RHOB|nr:peptidylprolyl isomerase [Pseudodonghicola flavimaris]MDK3017905.1 peptidylprolyl isomerase [Pseudodonghicola flavimaris]